MRLQTILSKQKQIVSFAPRPFCTLATEWHNSPIAKWAWLLGLTFAQKHELGIPPRAGLFLSFPFPLLPDATLLEDILTLVPSVFLVQGRHIEANLVSFNIGAIVDKLYTQGISAFGRKVAMLSAIFF